MRGRLSITSKVIFKLINKMFFVKLLPWLDVDKQSAVPTLGASVLPPTLPTSRSTNLNKYFNEHKEYWHLMLPRELSKQVPKTHLMSEGEWRRSGVPKSLGRVHFTIHKPESQTVLLNKLFQNINKNEVYLGILN